MVVTLVHNNDGIADVQPSVWSRLQMADHLLMSDRDGARKPGRGRVVPADGGRLRKKDFLRDVVSGSGESLLPRFQKTEVLLVYAIPARRHDASIAFAVHNPGEPDFDAVIRVRLGDAKLVVAQIL
ncbi:MAG: hypothetical protein LBD06_03915, partial [Candidatus Accumulibacter sp.]|nr:hypothetical protein [Accumulibacter sp.]